jgi:hypothetical protein
LQSGSPSVFLVLPSVFLFILPFDALIYSGFELAGIVLRMWKRVAITDSFSISELYTVALLWHW